MHRVAICWLRRDLRFADNPALIYACAHAERVVLAFIHAPDEEAPWQPGAASRWWLHHSLQALSRKQQIILRHGPSLNALQSLIDESAATLVVWNRLYESAAIARDTKIKTELAANGIEAKSCNAALLFEPWEIQTQQGQPYRVFTPFWRACAQRLTELAPPQPAPKHSKQFAINLPSAPIESFRLTPGIPWDSKIAAHWQPGEDGAHAALDQFIDDACTNYQISRDVPGIQGTSRIAPHLHFGEIGPRQVFASLQARANNAQYAANKDTFVRQLGWREFAHHVLFHFPQTTNAPFDNRFTDYPWERSDAFLRAWQRGRTGIPIVDAGMRELWQTGYMHNRVRMLVASLLTKNLRIHWLDGARWFWDTLVDADLANNTMGWQWTAGCGTDAAPFFRIFNPVLQGQRFDAKGIYVRRWLPELAALPDRWIHEPWAAPDTVLELAGVRIGESYPQPIIDLKRSRDIALSDYRSMRAQI